MHRWLFVGLAIMAAVGGVGTALVSGNRVKNPTLGLELIAMSEETSANGFVVTADRGNEPFARPSIPDPEELTERMKTVEQLVREHTARLKEIVEQYGWPGKRLVGFDGAHAAFQLLQQTGDKTFRAEALALMQRLPRGQVDAYDFAVTADRVALDQRKPQPYGTQIACNFEEGTVEVAGGVPDKAALNQRRAEIGLAPIDDDFVDARRKFGACAAQLGGARS